MAMPLPSPIPLTARSLRIRTRLAQIGIAAAWLAIVMMVYANFDASLVEGGSLTFDTIANTAFAVSFLLWVVMWLEYIRERPIKRPIAWFVILCFGPIPGAALFYYKVWRVRYRLNVDSMASKDLAQ